MLLYSMVTGYGRWVYLTYDVACHIHILERPRGRIEPGVCVEGNPAYSYSRLTMILRINFPLIQADSDLITAAMLFNALVGLHVKIQC